MKISVIAALALALLHTSPLYAAPRTDCSTNDDCSGEAVPSTCSFNDKCRFVEGESCDKDNDCDSKFCDRDFGECRPCVDDNDCDTTDERCNLSKGVCRLIEGEECSKRSDCASFFCDNGAGGICVAEGLEDYDFDSTCVDNHICQWGSRCYLYPASQSQFCLPKEETPPCGTDEDCWVEGGQKCLASQAGFYKCRNEIGTACSSDGNCQSFHCDVNGQGDMVCLEKIANGETCSKHLSCQSGYCKPVESFIDPSDVDSGVLTEYKCSEKGEDGVDCVDDYGCVSGTCNENKCMSVVQEDEECGWAINKICVELTHVCTWKTEQKKASRDPKQCVQKAGPGDSCGIDEHCHGSTTCIDGTCSPIPMSISLTDSNNRCDSDHDCVEATESYGWAVCGSDGKCKGRIYAMCFGFGDDACAGDLTCYQQGIYNRCGDPSGETRDYFEECEHSSQCPYGSVCAGPPGGETTCLLENGQPCDQSDECKSGNCWNHECDEGRTYLQKCRDSSECAVPHALGYWCCCSISFNTWMNPVGVCAQPIGPSVLLWAATNICGDYTCSNNVEV